MCEHLVQPLQGAVQVQLDPAGGAGHRLPPGGQKQMLATDRGVPGANELGERKLLPCVNTRVDPVVCVCVCVRHRLKRQLNSTNIFQRAG